MLSFFPKALPMHVGNDSSWEARDHVIEQEQHSRMENNPPRAGGVGTSARDRSCTAQGSPRSPAVQDGRVFALEGGHENTLQTLAHVYPHKYCNLMGTSKAFIPINLHHKHLH